MSYSKLYYRHLAVKYIITVMILVLCFLSFVSVNVLANSHIMDPIVMDNGPDPISGGEGGTTDSVVQNIVSTVYNYVTHKIFFPEATLKDALVNVFNDITKGGLKENEKYLKQVVYSVMRWVYGKDVSRNVKLAGWKVLLIVASALMPLSLIMTVGSAMKEGVTSVTGYAAAREAITQWIISVALAGGSYYIISLLTDVSSAASYKILEQTLTAWKIDPVNLFVGSFISGIEYFAVGPLGRLFLSLFALFTCIAVVTSLILAVFAREVVLLLLTIISPVVFILAPMEQTRWLSGLWTKAFTFTLLLGPINVILIAAGGMLYEGSLESAGARGLLGMVIAIGVVSILITINQAVGQMIYGAAIEIANKSLDTMASIAKVALTVVGFATGSQLVGAAAGGLGNSGNSGVLGLNNGPKQLPSGDGGDSSSTGLSSRNSPGITAKPNDDTNKMKEIFGRQRNAANDVSTVGRSLSSSGIPGLSSFGAGMQAAGGIGEMKAVGGLNEANKHSEINNQAFSDRASFNNSNMKPIIQAKVKARYDLPSAYAPMSNPPSRDELNKGVDHGVAGMQAYRKVGGSMTDYLALTTGYNPNASEDNFVSSAAAVIRADATQFLGYGSVSQHGILHGSEGAPHEYKWVREDAGVTTNDVRFAMDAVRKFDSTHATDANYIAGIAAGASRGRQFGGFSYGNMMKDMEDRNMNGLDNWALKVSSRFPNGPRSGSIVRDEQAMGKLADFFNNKRSQ